MSPKISRPDGGSDDDPGLPPGHVPIHRPARPKPPPRKPLPAWVKIVGFVVVLGATVGGIVYFAQPDDPRESAQGTAELVATALTEGDPSAFRSYLCADTSRLITDDQVPLGESSVLAVADEDVNGLVRATLTLEQDLETELVLGLEQTDDDSWCVFAPALCPVDEDPYTAPSGPSLCDGRPRP